MEQQILLGATGVAGLILALAYAGKNEEAEVGVKRKRSEEEEAYASSKRKPVVFVHPPRKPLSFEKAPVKDSTPPPSPKRSDPPPPPVPEKTLAQRELEDSEFAVRLADEVARSGLKQRVTTTQRATMWEGYMMGTGTDLSRLNFKRILNQRENPTDTSVNSLPSSFEARPSAVRQHPTDQLYVEEGTPVDRRLEIYTRQLAANFALDGTDGELSMDEYETAEAVVAGTMSAVETARVPAEEVLIDVTPGAGRVLNGEYVPTNALVATVQTDQPALLVNLMQWKGEQLIHVGTYVDEGFMKWRKTRQRQWIKRLKERRPQGTVFRMATNLEDVNEDNLEEEMANSELTQYINPDEKDEFKLLFGTVSNAVLAEEINREENLVKHITIPTPIDNVQAVDTVLLNHKGKETVFVLATETDATVLPSPVALPFAISDSIREAEEKRRELKEARDESVKTGLVPIEGVPYEKKPISTSMFKGHSQGVKKLQTVLEKKADVMERQAVNEQVKRLDSTKHREWEELKRELKRALERLSYRRRVYEEAKEEQIQAVMEEEKKRPGFFKRMRGFFMAIDEDHRQAQDGVVAAYRAFYHRETEYDQELERVQVLNRKLDKLEGDGKAREAFQRVRRNIDKIFTGADLARAIAAAEKEMNEV